MLWGVGSWVMGGGSKPIAQHVVETYIAAAGESRRWLQPGDEVQIRVDGLGVIANKIEP